MPVLELQGLSAAPWGVPLLRDIELQLRAGELLALIGPNGAGKSSLLHVIAGGHPVSSGAIRLGGRALVEWTREQRARSLALQSQHSALNFPFTVEEVILLGRLPHASGRACDGAILDEVLAATDTAALRRRLFTQLSNFRVLD